MRDSIYSCISASHGGNYEDGDNDSNNDDKTDLRHNTNWQQVGLHFH